MKYELCKLCEQPIKAGWHGRDWYRHAQGCPNDNYALLLWLRAIIREHLNERLTVYRVDIALSLLYENPKQN